mgnify:CR=1 FL=1
MTITLGGPSSLRRRRRRRRSELSWLRCILVVFSLGNWSLLFVVLHDDVDIDFHNPLHDKVYWFFSYNNSMPSRYDLLLFLCVTSRTRSYWTSKLSTRGILPVNNSSPEGKPVWVVSIWDAAVSPFSTTYLPSLHGRYILCVTNWLANQESPTGLEFLLPFTV